MLLEEPPHELIRSCTRNFNAAPDRSALQRINSNTTALSQKRASQISAAESTLKRTTRHLHALEQKHNLVLAAHDPVAHAEVLAKMDDERFELAKEANALEAEGSRLEGEIAGCRRAVEEVERRGGGWEGRGEEMGDVLRLKLYRSLGIDTQTDKNGNVTKVLVRNGSRPEVKVVEMDPRVSKAKYVDQIWDAL